MYRVRIVCIPCVSQAFAKLCELKDLKLTQKSKIAAELTNKYNRWTQLSNRAITTSIAEKKVLWEASKMPKPAVDDTGKSTDAELVACKKAIAAHVHGMFSVMCLSFGLTDIFRTS